VKDLWNCDRGVCRFDDPHTDDKPLSLDRFRDPVASQCTVPELDQRLCQPLATQYFETAMWFIDNFRTTKSRDGFKELLQVII
jgi:hypothetical protein